MSKVAFWWELLLFLIIYVIIVVVNYANSNYISIADIGRILLCNVYVARKNWFPLYFLSLNPVKVSWDFECLWKQTIWAIIIDLLDAYHFDLAFSWYILNNRTGGDWEVTGFCYKIRIFDHFSCNNSTKLYFFWKLAQKEFHLYYSLFTEKPAVSRNIFTNIIWFR